MEHHDIKTYKFSALDNQILETHQIKDCLFKWGLRDSLKILKFRFDLEFQTVNAQIFLQNLVGHPLVQTLLKIPSIENKKVNFKHKKCSLMNLNFLDKFEEKSNLNRIDFFRWSFQGNYANLYWRKRNRN